MQDEEIAGNDIIMIPLTPVKPLVTNGVKNRGIPFYEYKYWYIHKEKSVKFDACWHIYFCVVGTYTVNLSNPPPM